jgi:ApaG protein
MSTSKLVAVGLSLLGTAHIARAGGTAVGQQNAVSAGTGGAGAARTDDVQSGEKHSYTSGCLLLSPFGAMSGYYAMVNFATTRKFRVAIPTFKLSAPFAIN